MITEIAPKLYLRKDKIDKNGRMPVYIRFPRIEGEEPKFSIGRGVRFAKSEWDDLKQLPKDTIRRTLIEKELNRIKVEICKCDLQDIKITKGVLSKIVKGYEAGNPQNDSFFKYFDEFLESKERVDKIKMSSIKGYITTKNALLKFNSELCIKDITVENMNKFVAYMKRQGIEKGKGEVLQSIRNRLTHIRTLIKYINARGVEMRNPIGKGFVPIPPANEGKVVLTDKEVGKLIELHGNSSLTNTEYTVLTMYLFACATGLRISDVKRLKWDSLGLDKNVLTFLCKKTKRENYVPLTPLAGDMLCVVGERDFKMVSYGHNVFSRSFCDTTINNTLRKLAERVGINKNITTHTARRTFATLCDMKGVEFSVIEGTLGHKSNNITKRYCKWNEDRANMGTKNLSFLDAKYFLKAI